MLWSHLFPALMNSGTAATLVTLSAAPNLNNSNITMGFSGGYIASYSAGKAAQCYSGLIRVPINATTNRLAIAEPSNQTVVTEILQELYQANPTIFARTIAEAVTISRTFNIDATLCLPANVTGAQEVKTVQVLNHGIGFDKSYWDIAPGYSYVDAAAVHGYATLAYNRLGVGDSDHPDALQIVQATTDVEIQHEIVQLLRSGGGGLRSFKHVIGTAHSYGSIIQLIQNAKYPKDIDAAVVTGFVNDLTNLPYAVLANNPAIAAQNNPLKFGNLSTGYLVHDTPISIQIAFYRFPYFDTNSKFSPCLDVLIRWTS